MQKLLDKSRKPIRSKEGANILFNSRIYYKTSLAEHFGISSRGSRRLEINSLFEDTNPRNRGFRKGGSWV